MVGAGSSYRYRVTCLHRNRPVLLHRVHSQMPPGAVRNPPSSPLWSPDAGRAKPQSLRRRCPWTRSRQERMPGPAACCSLATHMPSLLLLTPARPLCLGTLRAEMSNALRRDASISSIRILAWEGFVVFVAPVASVATSASAPNKSMTIFALTLTLRPPPIVLKPASLASSLPGPRIMCNILRGALNRKIPTQPLGGSRLSRPGFQQTPLGPWVRRGVTPPTTSTISHPTGRPLGRRLPVRHHHTHPQP